MKEILDILLYFKGKGVVLSLDATGQRLEATGQVKSLTEADKATIAGHREALMAFLHQARQATVAPIQPLPQQASYPLSSAQQRLWVLSLFDEGNTAYNIAGVYTIAGPLDTAALAQSFTDLAERHESLRTIFKEDEQGEVRQYILPMQEWGFALTITDLQQEPDPQAVLQQAIQQTGQQPFDLGSGPLLRASLCRLAHEAWVLAFAMHHIISDGWSMGVLMNELEQRYTSRLQGKPSGLPPLRIQYKDYAAWQRAQLSGNALQAHKQYWLNQLSGELPVCGLLGDRPRPHIKTYNGALLHRQWQPSLVAGLRALCQQKGATLFMGLTAAVKALLYRYTGQQDIVIGSPIAGRENPELDKQIGFYLNTLALRTQFSGTDSFADLLGQVKQITLDAYRYQAYPFDELVDALALKRDMSRHALFDIMVILQNTGASQVEGRRLGEAVLQHYEGELPVSSKFDITFEFVERGDGLRLSIEYNTAIYNASTIQQMAAHLEQLLAKATAQPDNSLQSIHLLSPAEEQQLLVAFNDSGYPYNEDNTLVNLIEAQAAAKPTATALVVDGAAYTYTQLNEAANQLANYLQQTYQLCPGDVAGICLPRGYNMLLAMIAVLKTGAAYLPIEPSYPADRIDFMVTDSGSKLVITGQEMAAFEAVQPQLGKQNLQVAIHPQGMAYVIYTSGSTGQPKGVMLEHRNVVSFCDNFGELFGLHEGMTIAGTTNFTFDISVLELLCSLAMGLQLVLFTSPEPEPLLQAIGAGQVAALQVTPSRLSQLLELGADVLPQLQVLLVGGEALSPYYYEQLKKMPHTKAVNVYGPTEACIWTTGLDIASSNGLSIGKPLNNETIYILDERLGLQPIGVPGEICIGGDGLAKGYLNRPELTAEKFVQNPFVAGERLYRTGDLGRWLPDGHIEFLGRADQQVKIRGHRIELGEIEAVLQSLSGIEAAVVNAFDTGQGELALAAYIVSAQPIEVSALKEQAARSLPAYMVPTYFVQLPQLPLNTSGKVDSKRLPRPEGAGIRQMDYVAPRNTTEAQLLALWQQILGVEKPGATDNFFELGGHSLKATRLISLIYKTFAVKLTLKDLFIYPVAEQQALLIQKTNKTCYAEIVPTEEQDYYPLSPAQKRLFFLQEFAPDSTGYNMTSVNYLGQEVDSGKIADAIQQLVNRHESLRTCFVKMDGVPLQKVWPHIDVEMDQHQCAPAEFEPWLKRYIQPFDLSQAPLIRSALVHIETVGYVWVVDIHHIASDGTSQQVLADDFMQFYQGGTLPPLRLQYRDFSAWQNTMIENGEWESQVRYWQKQYEDGIPKLNFATDRPRPHTFTFEGANYGFNLGPELTQQLRRLGQQHQSTLQMTLLAVLNILLHRYTGQNDMVVGCGIAGRRHVDVERIAGMFVNSMAIRSYPQGNKRFDAFLKEVMASSLAAYENQDLQFEDLLDLLKVERDASRNPVFDISLIVQNFERSRAIESPLFKKLQPPHPLLPSLNKYDAGTSKFDMDWFVEETENDIAINVEYYAAIFNASTIEQLARHFRQILTSVLHNPDILLSEIPLLSQTEKEQMLQQYVQGPALEWPQNATVHGLFEKQCFLNPAQIAVESATETLSYQALNERSNQLAKFLRQRLGLQTGTRVGILQGPGADQVVSVMGVLKAGGVYVPLDSEYPEDRLLYMIEDAGMAVLLVEKRVVELANSLQWRCQQLQHLVCVDTEDFYAEKGVLKNDLMRKDLWDHIGELAEDAIGQGGWINSYTGEDFTPAEMEEYSQNIYQKLQPYLHSDTKVLEIGCSSGLTMFNLAPQVGSYFGTDLSSSILEKTAQVAKEKNAHNITLACMPADQIDTVPESDFDLVIINSVIQCFNGHNYLRDVLVKAIGKMKKTGLLFIGDIMDEDKRQDLIDDMVAFKKANRNPAWHTKTDWGQELFVSRSYLNDLTAANIGVVGAAYTDKIHTIPNELTRFRYDALLRIDQQTIVKPLARQKQQYDLREIRRWGTDLTNAGVQPHGAACIIYTSGTTGHPKGVTIGHGALVQRLMSEQQLLDISAKTVTCTATNFCFDVSLLEILLPLVMGGTIAVLNKETVLSPQLLIRELEARRVTLLQGTPSFIKGIVLEGLQQRHQLSLSHIAIGGESLNEALVKALQELLPNVTINNQYGPTEAVVDAIALQNVQAFRRNIIGRPLPNTSVYVLDDRHQLLPIGAVGELCIGGTALASGYHQREALTAEKFIANPYHPNERLYLTGDLGRYLQDGHIEFIGRKDDQVKVRGYRIELGEIEAALLTHQAVEAAFVMARANQQGDQELVAYLVAGQPLNMAELRAHIGKTLPAYMVPYYFMQLSALPLNSNGKVDRKKLPLPQGADMQVSSTYQAPRNPVEEKVADIWQEILGVEKVGVTDNFFEVGGHSLRVIRVLSKVRGEFGVDIKIEDVFSHPTIEFMAKEITRKQWTMNSLKIKSDEKTVITI
jgi:amino acid adenylation domain-containing protein